MADITREPVREPVDPCYDRAALRAFLGSIGKPRQNRASPTRHMHISPGAQKAWEFIGGKGPLRKAIAEVRLERHTLRTIKSTPKHATTPHGAS